MRCLLMLNCKQFLFVFAKVSREELHFWHNSLKAYLDQIEMVPKSKICNHFNLNVSLVVQSKTRKENPEVISALEIII